MGNAKKTSRAGEILHRRYVEGKPEREASVQAERVNAEVARMIHDLRYDAGLTQKELAELIGTTQSVISRLEDSGYEGHSLSMLTRIAKALNQRLTVLVTAAAPQDGVLRHAFQLLVRNLRRSKGLTTEQLAKKCGVDASELAAIEQASGVRPSPRTLDQLARFYGIPTRQFAALAGAVTDVPEEIRESASRFAAHSESFARLSKDEKRVLDQFIRFLTSEAKA